MKKWISAMLLTISFAGVTTLAPAPAAAGGALRSCHTWTATGRGPNGGPNSVAAWCARKNGSWNWTELWLPGCMAAVGNGSTSSLRWVRAGYFDRVCRDCWVGADRNAGTIRPYGCTCKLSNSDRWAPYGIWSTINLNDLDNWDGNLHCPI